MDLFAKGGSGDSPNLKFLGGSRISEGFSEEEKHFFWIAPPTEDEGNTEGWGCLEININMYTMTIGTVPNQHFLDNDEIMSDMHLF